MFSGNSQNDLTALGNASEAQAEKQHTARDLGCDSGRHRRRGRVHAHVNFLAREEVTP